jgi:hypothetical protein
LVRHIYTFLVFEGRAMQGVGHLLALAPKGTNVQLHSFRTLVFWTVPNMHLRGCILRLQQWMMRREQLYQDCLRGILSVEWLGDSVHTRIMWHTHMAIHG